MINIKEIIKRTEYNWIEKYKDRLMFLTFGGSHAYGTNLSTSDIDIRGVMLPTVESLIGLKTEDQCLDIETDTCIYEFNKFIKLVSNCNPNTIEMLGCRPSTYLFFNDFGEKLVDKKNLFLSQKAIHSFGGYATSQLRRLQNANCHDSYNDSEKEKHILLKMLNVHNRNLDNSQRFANKINLTMGEKEILINIVGGDYNLRELAGCVNEFVGISRSFDKLSHRNSKKDDLHLAKHAMHLVRLYLMCFDIVENKEIVTYREIDHDLLMEIRTGLWSKDNGQMQDRFFDMIGEFEKKLKTLQLNTTLPNLPDYAEIEHFMVDVNRSVINGDIKQYEH